MKTNQFIAAITFAIIALTSCNKPVSDGYTNRLAVKEFVTSKTNDHPGKKLLEQQCYVCHNPSDDHDGRIAPPMVAVKSHYMTDSITKKQFVDAIWNFVKKPSEEKSKMRGAVRRFNLMPDQSFNEEEVRLIADYMYQYKIDEPDWFKKHIEEENKGNMKYRNDGKKIDRPNSEKKQSLVERGLGYALNTKKELGKNLMGTIQKKGTKEAVTFCNVQAFPITDSMATALKVSIKRVSDKPRNIKNQANNKELDIIKRFKKAVANGEDYDPIIEKDHGLTNFYYPITTNSMFLQCHGTPNKTIQPEVLSTISKLYPQDKATGYSINEVRGIWAIAFDETDP